MGNKDSFLYFAKFYQVILALPLQGVAGEREPSMNGENCKVHKSTDTFIYISGLLADEFSALTLNMAKAQIDFQFSHQHQE